MILQRHTIANLSVSFWLVLALVVIGFYPLVDYLYYKTVRANELSSVLPLMGLVPIMTLATGYLLLRQKPSFLGITGIILISLSIYILQLEDKVNWLDPIKNVFNQSAARAMLIISFATAIAAIGDKYAINHSSSTIYYSLNSLGAILVLIISDVVASRGNLNRLIGETKQEFIKQPWKIILMSLLLLVTQILGFAALQFAPVAGYAVGIRNLNLVFASALAIWYLGEGRNHYKLFSYGLSALGVIMIAL